MLQNEENIKKQLSWKKIILPILIGLGVSVYLLVSDLSKVSFQEAIGSEKGTHAWVDSNGNNKVDLSDRSEFIPSDQGAYVAKKTKDVILEYEWSFAAILSLFGALLMLVLRDFFYMYRIRVLSNGHLS